MQPTVDEGVDLHAARALQDSLDRLNAADPAGLDAPYFLAKIRHGCTKTRLSGPTGRPVAAPLDLKEVYVPSSDEVHALIYRQGECPKCHLTARSRVGRAVLTAQRPPVYGRVGRD